jgi:hypothetical protein
MQVLNCNTTRPKVIHFSSRAVRLSLKRPSDSSDDRGQPALPAQSSLQVFKKILNVLYSH